MTGKLKYRTIRQGIGFLALVLFFCLVASGSNALNSATDDKALGISGDNFLQEHAHTTLDSEDFHAYFLHIPLAPAEPQPNPFEPGEQDYNENEEEDNWHRSYLLSDQAILFLNRLSKNSIAQYEPNVLNRTRVSLVVLHHSWKSFLA